MGRNVMDVLERVGLEVDEDAEPETEGGKPMPRKRDALHSLSLRLIAAAIRRRVEQAHQAGGGPKCRQVCGCARVDAVGDAPAAALAD